MPVGRGSLTAMLLPDVIGREAPPVEVTALAYDNRAVTPGTLFFCVPGFTRDGHDFAPDAIARGAVALVVERPLALGVPEVLVDDARAAMAPAAAALAGDPTARLTTVGITGTNGKTTSAFILRALLEAGGHATGLYSESRYVASFIGFAPALHPKLLIEVTVDEPQTEIYGGVVAAPAFERIASFALPYLRIPPG